MMFWSKKQEKADLDRAVAAAAVPATGLLVETATEDDLPFPTISSHFGGDPYAESGETWPTWGDEGRPYDFICQIDLRECQHCPDVPLHMITVFLCWRAIEEVDIDGACLVRAYRDPSPEKAAEIRKPDPLAEDDYRVTACSVEMATTVTYPWAIAEHPGVRAVAAKFRDPHAACVASLTRLGYWHDRFFSRVGGFPTWVSDNTLEYDDMVFLVQIAHEPCADNCIQDDGPIYIAVSAGDPTRIEADAFQSF
jgi:Domain of unknown function (DUF1963)